MMYVIPLFVLYGDSLDGALIYLENFAPDEARERFEERIRSLFETKWIIELVDMAMLKIREYPDKGALYCEIISKAYLNRLQVQGIRNAGGSEYGTQHLL